MTPFLVGIFLAVVVAVIGNMTRFDQERSFYSTVLIVIASYYVLFAIQGESTDALVREIVIALAFLTVAIFGALCFPLLVGIGIVAHGLFDLVHPAVIHNPGVPSWWPGFCMSIDVALGLWVIGLSRFRQTLPQRTSP